MFETDAGGYVANAVKFDGTNDYLTRAGLANVAEGTQVASDQEPACRR